MMCLSNFMQSSMITYTNETKTRFDSLWAHSTVSVSGFAAGRPNLDPYMTYLSKSLWFTDLPPLSKGVRFVEDGLPVCCDLLELALVFEARDLTSVIQQTVRSGIWRNWRRRKLRLISKIACENRSSESPCLSSSNYIRHRSRFQTPGDG